MFFAFGGSVIVVVIWLILFASIFSEQGSLSIRAGSANNFRIADVINRQQHIRWYTLEVFNPDPDRAVANYGILNFMHNARYIGIFLLPFLGLLPFYHWRRLERWLGITTIFVLIVSTAPE